MTTEISVMYGSEKVKHYNSQMDGSKFNQYDMSVYCPPKVVADDFS